jgi:hypothetical protein
MGLEGECNIRWEILLHAKALSSGGRADVNEGADGDSFQEGRNDRLQLFTASTNRHIAGAGSSRAKHSNVHHLVRSLVPSSVLHMNITEFHSIRLLHTIANFHGHQATILRKMRNPFVHYSARWKFQFGIRTHGILHLLYDLDHP